jgi:hypothetical protein
MRTIPDKLSVEGDDRRDLPAGHFRVCYQIRNDILSPEKERAVAGYAGLSTLLIIFEESPESPSSVAPDTESYVAGRGRRNSLSKTGIRPGRFR